MSESNRYYEEYLSSLKTKLAKHQAKKSLDRNANFARKGLSVREVIQHLLFQKGHHAYYTRNREKSNKFEYFIGTNGGSIIDLNKTTFGFAKFLIEQGYCSKDSKVIDFDSFMNATKIEGDNWLEHIKTIDITDVLLSSENFGKFSVLVEYINGLKTNPKNYVDVYSAYSKKLKKLDVFEKEDYLKLPDDEYVRLVNISSLLKTLFKSTDIIIDKRVAVLQAINSEFHYQVNKMLGQV